MMIATIKLRTTEFSLKSSNERLDVKHNTPRTFVMDFSCLQNVRPTINYFMYFGYKLCDQEQAYKLLNEVKSLDGNETLFHLIIIT